MNQELKLLERKAGLVFMSGALDYQDSPAASQKSAKMAMDAQSPLIGDPSAGLLAFMGTYIDPKLIEACLSPLAAVEVSGSEVKKGDWVTHTAAFPK